MERCPEIIKEELIIKLKEILEYLQKINATSATGEKGGKWGYSTTF